MAPGSGLPASWRWFHIEACELHGGFALADIQQIHDPHIEDVGEVHQHLERWIPAPLFEFLQVPVRDALRGDLLLRQALAPPSPLEVPAQALEDLGEIHGSTVLAACTRIEPTGSALFTIEDGARQP